MIDRTVLRMYEESEENQFLEVTYAGGDKEVLYFKDFNSGAMIQNIVDRAKKMAIKDLLDTGVRGLRIGHLLQACLDEFAENEDLPNTTNPDDWAKISGKKGERIVFIRTLDQLQAGHPAGPLDRHGLQHRPVPVGASLLGGALDRSFVAAVPDGSVSASSLLLHSRSRRLALLRALRVDFASRSSAAICCLTRSVPQLRG